VLSASGVDVEVISDAARVRDRISQPGSPS
jgi:hypothetical protein